MADRANCKRLGETHWLGTPSTEVGLCARPQLLWVFFAVFMLLPQLALADVEGRPCGSEPVQMNYGDVITCSIDPVGDTDVFQFSGSTGETVDILVSRRDGEIPCVELFDPQARAIGTRQCSSFGASIRAQLTLTGSNTIRISEFNNDRTVQYTLALERIAPPSPTAKPLSFTQTYTDEINPIGDSDLFFFSGRASDVVDILVSRRNGEIPCVELFDPQGKGIGARQCSSFGASIRGQLTLTGTHTIRVSEFNNDRTVEYTLSLQCLGACSALTRTVSFFPLVADGRLTDGTFYTSSLLVYARAVATSCDLNFRGIPAPQVTRRDGSTVTGPSIHFDLNSYGWEVLRTSGSGVLTTTGYAELLCTGDVDSQMLYTFYDKSGLKLSEAAVFAQTPAAYRVAQLILDQRRGESLGIATANAMDHAANLRLSVTNADGLVVRETTLSVNAGSVLSKFVDELVSGLPASFVGKVIIRANDLASADEFHATGLSFTGPTFTTVPVVPYIFSSGATLPECREVR